MSAVADTNVTLRGERELVERAGHLFFGAREEFMCAAAGPSTWALPGIRRELVADRRRKAPDLRVCKLYGPGALAGAESERHLVEVSRKGVRVRICPVALPHETIIIDRRIAVLAGPPVRGDRQFTVVRSPDVVRSVRSLYQATWESAVELADYVRLRPPEIDEQGRAILRMLGEGLKDETAARRIGLSLRTYRRRVAELMETLDAGSRFQAGLRARELGL